MNLNTVLLGGRLTRDPELKTLPSGIMVTSFSVAINNSYKDKDGNKKDNTEFVNIVVFGKQAESCGTWLKKGQEAFIEGRLQTRSWDDKDGHKNYRTEVVADRVQFGSRTGATAGEDSPKPNALKPGYMNKLKKAEPETSDTKIEYPAEEINPDDIPF